jgi:hypothetical protein
VSHATGGAGVVRASLAGPPDSEQVSVYDMYVNLSVLAHPHMRLRHICRGQSMRNPCTDDGIGPAPDNDANLAPSTD